MPYVERVTKAGNTIEIERYFTSRYKKKGISRGDKVKPTKEEQEKVNTRQAERKLRILINANYGYGDYHLVLDYIRRKGEPDRTPEQMRQDIDVFLRECRKEYRKAGLEFKYIHVMEIGKKGARHHHLVVNKIDTEILQRCWYKAYEGHNRVKVFPLDDSGNYAELASYLIKYTGTHKKGTDGALQGKRWNCSKNLVRPEPEYRIISDREYFKKEPKAIKGYYVDKNSVSMGVHSPEYYGYGYLRYTLVKITDRGGAEMQIIKGIAIAAVLIIAGLLALIVAAYLAFRIAAAIFEQQESWKDSGSRKGRKHDRKN
nr:MAG: replication gene A protein [Bacteriophage sp.]UWG18090.1 MAG: replication gene A protein [Bacteriophage sp.]